MHPFRRTAHVHRTVAYPQQAFSGLRQRLSVVSQMTMVLTAIAMLTFCLCVSQSVRADDSSEKRIQYFESKVRPVLAARCYSCHSKRAGKQEGGLSLDSRDGWVKGGGRGKAVVPGDVDASLLIRAVRYTDPSFQMPPKEKLSNEDIAALESWIKMGAPAPTNVAESEFSHPSDPVAGKQHWAYQPLNSKKVPAVKREDWPRSAIDWYVLSRLEQVQLSPVADAIPADLIRRLSFQLVGLPPVPDHIERYQQFPTTETLATIVDELLASPQFGQRWGRHWLDVSRFADSNGLDENFLLREAWRYRNWVIDAVNSDVSLDRFLLEQLAGDLLPYDSIAQRDRQRIAAGFLVVGPKVLLGVNPERQRLDVADEQIETIGRAVLGQTLGCARCHDHKFDPIPTADYYAIAGILTSTKVMEKRHMLNEQRVMERLVGLGENGEMLDNAYEAYFRNLPGLKARAKKAQVVLDLLQKKDEQAIAEKLVADGDGFCDLAKNVGAESIDQRIAAQNTFVQELKDSIAKPPAIPPRAMIPAESDKIGDEAIRLSGRFDAAGDKVPRGFLTVLCDGKALPIPSDQSGRVELARWLTDGNSRSGWLTARVQANRIWHHLIGRGLVRTVDNFGRTGEAPSHPELLDHLALQLIDEGWSVKSLVRKIVLSRTFAMSSQHDATNEARDPDNRLLWRAHRRRLDPESLRDAMLSAAGTLDVSPVESTVSYLGDQATAVGDNALRRRTDFNCRSVYLPVIRNDLPELFEVFDFANPHFTTGVRPKTTVPTQGLFMLNDSMVMAAAGATAGRVMSEANSLSPEARIDRMFQLIVSGLPTDNERQAVKLFLEQATSGLTSSGVPDPELKALTLACHAVLASSRFQFLE